MPRLGGGGGSPAPRRVVRRKPQAPSAAQVNAATNPQPVRSKPVPPAGPSPRQVRQARVQRQQIVQSERSVGTQARQQRRQAQARRRVRVAKANRQQIVSSERAVGAAARFADRQQRFVNPTPAGPLHDIVQAITHPAGTKAEQRILAPRIKAYQAHVHEEKMARVAPVLKTLNQLSRGYHATAGATDELVKGHGLKGAVHGLKEGALHNKPVSYSDVLRDAGVKNKLIRSVGGFAGDVLGDPSTYVMFGAGSVAEHAAARAGMRAEKKALAQGLSKDQAKAFGERAAKQAVKKTPERKGLTVKVAGKEVPTVRRASAQAARPVKATARKVTTERARASLRAKAADVNPNIAPVGASRVENRAGIMATRTARAKSSHGVHMAQQLGLGIRKQIGEKNYQTVIDALESGKIGSLPEDLRKHAVAIRSQLRYANRLRKQAGIRGGERTNYVPHVVEPHVLEAKGKTVKGVGASVGRKVIRPSSSRARKIEGTLAELRQTHPGEYSENLAQITADRMAEGHTAVARAELNRALAEHGRAVRKGDEHIVLHKGEAVFHIVGSDISKPLSQRDMEHLLEHGTHAGGAMRGRYVVLNQDVVKRATEGTAPTLEGPGIIHGYDRAQAGFKRVATFTPGFHVRNIIGDLQNSYLGQAAHRMPGNLIRAGRVLKAYGRQEKALKDLTPAQVGKATLKTKRYGNVTYDEVAQQLRNHGAFRSGYIARELPELEHSGMQAEAKLKRFHPVPEKLKRAALAREDLPRLTTAMQALREGATWQEAAERVASLHFDYQHLTQFERQVMRRVMPFYTWSARNIPLQAKTLVTRPGKYAHIQALREEAQKASGVDQQQKQVVSLYKQLQAAGVKLSPGWERYISDYEQHNAGIPITWKGHQFTLSAGLPYTDVGYLPGVAGANEFRDRASQLVTPIIKDPTELAFNYSFFFHDQIERDNSPLVAAPAEVGSFPASVKEKLGIVKMVDKKSGKKVWAWPGKVDYVAHAIPGLPSTGLQLSTPGGRSGKGLGAKIVSASGVKSTPIDPVKNAMDLAYQRQAEIQKQLAVLRQQGITAKNPTARYTLLNKQLKIVTQIAYQTKQAQGYKVLPRSGGPAQGRGGSTSGDFPSSSSGSYFPESDSGGFFPGS